MNNNEIRSLYGLKYNPFLPDVPADALFTMPCECKPWPPRAALP